MFACPICGRDTNRKGEPFESKEPVISHIDGSHDPDHQGLSGEEMRKEIEEVEEPDPAPKSEAVEAEPGGVTDPLGEPAPSSGPDAGTTTGGSQSTSFATGAGASASGSTEEATASTSDSTGETQDEVTFTGPLESESEANDDEGSMPSLLALTAVGAFLWLFADTDQLLNQEQEQVGSIGPDRRGGRL